MANVQPINATRQKNCRIFKGHPRDDRSLIEMVAADKIATMFFLNYFLFFSL